MRSLLVVVALCAVAVYGKQPACDSVHVVCAPCPYNCDANVSTAAWWYGGSGRWGSTSVVSGKVAQHAPPSAALRTLQSGGVWRAVIAHIGRTCNWCAILWRRGGVATGVWRGQCRTCAHLPLSVFRTPVVPLKGVNVATLPQRSRLRAPPGDLAGGCHCAVHVVAWRGVERLVTPDLTGCRVLEAPPVVDPPLTQSWLASRFRNSRLAGAVLRCAVRH